MHMMFGRQCVRCPSTSLAGLFHAFHSSFSCSGPFDCCLCWCHGYSMQLASSLNLYSSLSLAVVAEVMGRGVGGRSGIALFTFAMAMAAILGSKGPICIGLIPFGLQDGCHLLPWQK